MAKQPQPFNLSDEGRKALSAMLRKGTHPACKLNRARTLLKLDQGQGPRCLAGA